MSDFPFVIRGARVIDGTGYPAGVANVGISGNLIGVVDRACRVRGEAELDADGLTLAPGFIDSHSHSDLVALSRPELAMKVRQGITLDVLGQDGISVAPNKTDDVPQLRRSLAGLLGDPDLDWSWRSVADYLGALEAARPALDTAYLVPHGAIRLMALGLDDRPARADELEAMKSLLERGLKDGAVGMSTGLIYPPCCYAPTDELVELAKVVKRFDGAFVVHIRSESDRAVESIDEMLEVTRRSGVHMHISHFKIAGSRNWGRIGEMLDRIEACRAAGFDVTADQYPYVAGSTMMGAILPPWAHVGGVDATLARLADPAQRARMKAALVDDAPTDWDNFWQWGGPEGIRVADIPSGRRQDLLGLNLAEAAGRSRVDPVDFAFDLLAGERMGVAMVSFSQSEEVIERIMKTPWVSFCTDGLIGAKPHPRTYGSFPRVLARYVRERGVLTLEQAVAKATFQAAKAYRLTGCGQVRKGQRANLVLFDPATVMDRATFEDPLQFPEGIPHVVVEGELVVHDGEITPARPGRVVRALAPGCAW